MSTLMKNEERSSGTVTRWIDNRGFGFIREDGTGDTVFVHESAIRMGGWRCLLTNAKVTFVKLIKDGKFIAMSVMVEQDV